MTLASPSSSMAGLPVATTAPIVIAERLTDLVALILLVALGGLCFPGGRLYAAAAGTLGYELMCARAPRVPVRVASE